MPYTQVTLAVWRTRLFERVDTSAHWVNAEADTVLNDCLKFWNLLTGRWRRTVSLTIQPASDPYIALPSTFTWPMRMTHAAGTPIQKTSIAALDRAQRLWEGQTTAAGGSVPATITHWAPRSLLLVAVWPRPTVATDVIFDGVSETPVLSGAADTLDLDEGLLGRFLALGAHWLQWKDGGRKFLSSAPALNQFILAAGTENAAIRSTTLYRTAAARDKDLHLRPRTAPLPAPPGMPEGA